MMVPFVLRSRTAADKHTSPQKKFYNIMSANLNEQRRLFTVSLYCTYCHRECQVDTVVVPHPRDKAFDLVCKSCQKPGFPKVAMLRHLRKSW
jgi:hypothetical protein